MSKLSEICAGKNLRPRRLMVYGTAGIGKTSFAASAPSPIFIQTEDGLGDIECSKFPLAKSFDEVIASLSALYSDEHNYQTVVIDSLDWLERLIWGQVCLARQVASIEDIGYQKGYSFALAFWRDVLDGLTALRDHRGMNIILIAHARIERFENPETEAYDRYVPRLNKLAAALIGEWCDEVLFATYRVFTIASDQGFNQKRVQGVGTGERILRTVERPSHIAKNRLALPEELPLAWAPIADHLSNRSAAISDTINL
jgi:hypothetical protein